MGVVYRARDTKLDRFVSLKFLHPPFVSDEEPNRRFIREAQAASALDHPNICTVFDILETKDGRLFIVGTFYPGKTVKELLNDGPLPPDQALSIASQIADALSAAHEADIIHRDIKPANIILADRGRPVLLDFGVAKLTGSQDLTMYGSTVGTMNYMSPE